MPGNVNQLENIQGLPDQQVPILRRQYGKNIFQPEPQRRFIHIAIDVIKEPMFILLAIACSLYFILGEESEGFMMLLAMCLVTAISLYQEVKSSNALKALQQFAAPKVTVIRNGKESIILTEEIVPGDIVLLVEGMNIPADAVILQSNDLSVNESIITGESFPVEKNETGEQHVLFQGTTINTGKCIARVTATGNNTELGKIGKAISSYSAPKTLLQLQINRFVRRLALFGLVAFFIIFFVNYLHQQEWATSLLFALTLAMSAVPEEIPVAFSSFMALGAYKMSRLGIISRQPHVVENLGSVNVICLDKTGTITENRMQVRSIYDHNSNELIELTDKTQLRNNNVLRFAALASETDPFDAMEKAIWAAYNFYKSGPVESIRTMSYEYPLDGQPPMMTHVYNEGKIKTVAGKGAAERIIQVCKLGEEDTKRITEYVNKLASNGYRVIAISSAEHSEPQLPNKQDEFNWQFEGLLGLYDPPKKNIPDVLKQFYNAKIEIKMITGDHPDTAINIAKQVGIIDPQKYFTGEQVMKMNTAELQQVVKDVNIFARMFPDAKLKVVEALKTNGEIVAMTGDGVNDGPALKAANIGIAMGQKGTEIARQAADLILTDDDLDRMVIAIREGRKIFSNLKKAIRYIISIHIPIILTASLPVILGWSYPNIFTPIHVIFLELIMGPTCSIFFEREPVEGNIMLQAPRKKGQRLFSGKELAQSMVQGIIIAAGVLGLYYYFMDNGTSLEQTRTIVFTTLILSNVFLTFVNRSFTRTIFYTSRYTNNLAVFVIIISALCLAAIHFIPPVRNLFQLTGISMAQFWVCLIAAFISVMWFEVFKALRFKIK